MTTTITPTTTLAELAAILGRQAGGADDPWAWGCGFLRAAADYLRRCRLHGVEPERDSYGMSDDMHALMDLVAAAGEEVASVLLPTYSSAAHDAEDAAILAAADEIEASGDLMDIDSGDVIRTATIDERWASAIAARHDGGRGAIRVDGRTCYVG